MRTTGKTKSTPPSLFKRGDTWHCRFSHCGKQYRFSTGESDHTAAQISAQREWLRVTALQFHGAEIPFSPLQCNPALVFERHINDLDNVGRNLSTTYNYEHYSIRFFMFFPGKTLGTISKSDIERWRDWLLTRHREDRGHKDKTLSPKYVTEHLNWIGSVYNHFGLPNPTAKVERPRISHHTELTRLKYFTREEMKVMLKACPDEFRPSLTFLAYTGCRDAEHRAIKNSPADIDAEKQVVWITGKGARRRQLSLYGPAQPAWEALQAEITRRGVEEGERVFAEYDRWADKRLRALCKSVGIPERGPHALRHTFATFALMYWGWDITYLAKWLGHDIAVTFRVYGHLVHQEPPRIEF